MPKNRIIVKYTTLLLKYLVNLFNIIRDINILDILKMAIIINYPRKVHSITVYFHITKRWNEQFTHQFLSRF